MRRRVGLPAGPGAASAVSVALAVLAALSILAAGCARVPPPRPQPVPPPAAQPPAPTPAQPSPPFSELPPVLPGQARTGWLDVGLEVDADSARIEVAGDAALTGAVDLGELRSGQTLVARSAGGRVLVQPVPAARDLALYEVPETLFVIPRSPAALVLVNGRRYRGEVKVFRAPGGHVTAVNRVGVEDYLRGVLPHEIGKLDARTLEAGKAQAVAARTYALSYVGRRSDQGFDVYATVEDQLYGGAADEAPLPDRCVRETAGIVGTYQGRFIRANYFSTCGGVTANVEDVWPEPALPWLRSRVDAARDGDTPFCAGSPQYRWTEIWGAQEFLDIVNRTYPALVHPLPMGGASVLRDVRVRSRSRSGRVAEVEIDTDIGTLVLKGDSTRRVLLRPARSAGAGGPGTFLRSSFFKIGVVRGRDGRVRAVVATGAGFGHGVGMCQWGALEMSRRGYDYRRILEHYFTGVRLMAASDLRQ